METVALENDNKNLKNIEVYPSYEDDFEKDSDTFTKDSSSQKVSSDDDQDIISPPRMKASSPQLLIDKEEKEVEKGQLEVDHGKPEAQGKERSLDEPSDSEPENDAYNFTEDQKRAMMELMVQKQEDGDLIDEDPPEYNVKGRIEQLNAELAKEPIPEEKDRETRVGFKPEIVDLVAPPPPDFSDDDSRPNSARGQETAPSTNQNGTPQIKDNERLIDKSKEQYVVERDGNFFVLSANELTPSERAMLLNDDSKVKKVRYPSDNQIKSEHSQEVSKRNNAESEHIVPQPPPQPRPKSSANGPRRNILQPSARPKSANNPNIEMSNNADNFNYKSPYAMTPAQKEEAKREARKQEEEKLKEERKKQEDEEERKKESMDAFQAWLDKKKEEQKKKGNDENSLQSEQERKKNRESVSSQNESFDSFEVIYPYLLHQAPKEENEKAYKTWLKDKRTQGKREKLLKKRQQQDQMEGYFIRSKEECERAFKEWLKKKNVESRTQHAMEKQKIRAYKIHMRRSKKTQALLKALKESEGSQYLDYYGYRY